MYFISPSSIPFSSNQFCDVTTLTQNQFYHLPSTKPRSTTILSSPSISPPSHPNSLSPTSMTMHRAPSPSTSELSNPATTLAPTSPTVRHSPDDKRGSLFRPIHLVYVSATLLLLSHAFSLLKTVSTYNSLSHGRATLRLSDFRTIRRHSFRAGNGPASRSVVIITASTKHYKAHIRNLHCSVRAATEGHLPVVFALDSDMAKFSRREGIPTIDARYGQHTEEQPRPYKFNSRPFNDVSKLKLRAVYDALLSGVDVLFSDVDVVWCDNAARTLVQRLFAHPWAHVLIQNGRSLNLQWPVEPNTGFFYVRRTVETLRMFEFLVRKSTDPALLTLCDQFLFKRLVCDERTGEGVAINNTKSGRATHGCLWRRKVGVDFLPLETYPNGHWPLGVPFNNLKPGQLRQACQNRQIAVFHNNFCDAADKVKRMDRQGLWSVRRSSGQCQRMGKDEIEQ